MSDFEEIAFQARYSSLDGSNLNCFIYQRRSALAKIPIKVAELKHDNLQHLIRHRRNAII